MASSTLPPPFNLIPTASGIKDMCKWFRLLAKPSDGQRAKCSLAHCCYIESETEAYINSEFPSLMSELAQRYICLKAHKEKEKSIQEIEDLRNEICEMKEMLRKFYSCRRGCLFEKRVSEDMY
ncbi:hypothetical protein RUM44_003236 [Polyplax serrata]|uniref:Uncharacterized protein n=1 Tax=Polyplax serrata TaxID=468196 RepID=A0ABR1AXX7_POLSC